VIPIIPVAVSSAPTGGQGSGLVAPPPLALYVHWPWCVKKCPYCDFNSHESRTAIDEPAYLAALIADLEAALPQIWNRPVVSVFIGGGTPSLMRAETADALLAAIRMRLPLHPGAEITLEANPGTAEAAKFAAFREAGVNRLSIGVQSFDDAKLAALGRIHGSAEARRAIDLALTHFERVNLDLMYALPRQSLKEAERDIATAIGTGVGHISAYHLTLEPNTPFHHAPPPLPDDDLAADMQEMVEERLAAAGITKPRPSPNPSSTASTTSTTGPSAITLDWAPVPTASSRTTKPSGVKHATAIRVPTWKARHVATSSARGKSLPAPTCPVNS
jgi:oxygen-independent coproporphyrinogen-3 oxidase